MQVFIGNQRPSFRAVECSHCGESVLPLLSDEDGSLRSDLCLKCALNSASSDLYKERYGVRPRFSYGRSLPQAIAFWEELQ